MDKPERNPKDYNLLFCIFKVKLVSTEWLPVDNLNISYGTKVALNIHIYENSRI